MIITVTLNAALDKTLEVPNFTPGRRHRTVDQTTMPGGKGVNVARALKRLGQPVIATGFAGGAMLVLNMALNTGIDVTTMSCRHDSARKTAPTNIQNSRE